MARQTKNKKVTAQSSISSKNKTKTSSESLLQKCERMQLKRFPDGLTPGAKRSRKVFPHDAKVDYPTSSGALCRGCEERIGRGMPRAALFLQCHLGYKDKSLTHYMHLECLPKHPEARKITCIDEFVGLNALTKEDRGKLEIIVDVLKKPNLE